MTVFCAYCGFNKPADEFTDEHPLPRSLGGNLRPTNPFLIRVCRGCNQACGRWIDGRFVRSWLISNSRAASFDRLYRKTPLQIFPLIHGGPQKDWHSPDGTVCDFWLGPTGDHVYHFHRPYPDANVFAGVPPHVKATDVDPGRVFLAFVAENPQWHPLVYGSVRAAFDPSAPIHFLNAAPEGFDPPHPPPSPGGIPQLNWIRSLSPGSMRVSDVSFDIDFGVRFLMKCALGFGTALLGDAYVHSSGASDLRAAMWQRDISARERFQIRGVPFFGGEQNDLGSVLGFQKCHTVSFHPTNSSLMLSLIFYNSHKAVIEVSNDSQIWGPHIPSDGIVWVIFPPTGSFVGPLGLPEYIAANITGSTPARGRLDAMLAVGDDLPSREDKSRVTETKTATTES